MSTRLLRLLAVVLALLWLVFPGFGLVDLTVTWSAGWPVMLEAGWGMLVTAGLGSPLLVAAIRPRLAGVALAQLLSVTAVLLVAAVVSLEPETWWMFVLAAPSLAVADALRRRHQRPADPATAPRRSRAVLALAAVAAPFALFYAWQMAAANRAGPPVDVTNGVDHYAVQAALGLALVVLPVVAGWWAPARRMFGTHAGLMAAYCGLVSFNWPGAVGGWSPAVSVGALVWGATLGVAVWWPLTSRTAPRVSTPSQVR